MAKNQKDKKIDMKQRTGHLFFTGVRYVQNYPFTALLSVYLAIC